MHPFELAVAIDELEYNMKDNSFGREAYTILETVLWLDACLDQVRRGTLDIILMLRGRRVRRSDMIFLERRNRRKR